MEVDLVSTVNTHKGPSPAQCSKDDRVVIISTESVLDTSENCRKSGEGLLTIPPVSLKRSSLSCRWPPGSPPPHPAPPVPQGHQQTFLVEESGVWNVSGVARPLPLSLGCVHLQRAGISALLSESGVVQKQAHRGEGRGFPAQPVMNN